jgi:hypothetical protein
MSEINFDAPHNVMALMQVLQTTLIKPEDTGKSEGWVRNDRVQVQSMPFTTLAVASMEYSNYYGCNKYLYFSPHIFSSSIY